jgi:FixJ family two-component response regulator
LSKPLVPQELLAAIDAALGLDRTARQKRSELAELQGCYDRLTPREREVLPFVVAGYLNKQTAGDLGMTVVDLRPSRLGADHMCVHTHVPRRRRA